jgi:hypothetical protein
MKRTTAGLALAAMAATALVAATAPAQAAPPSNGCPSNWQRLWEPSLTALGYRVPLEVDDPANSYSFGNQPGNGNHWVCALPLGNQSFNGLQIYNFMDDSLQVG